MGEKLTVAALVVLLAGGVATRAQQSASHRLDEHVFNAGGHPIDGAGPGSASHRLTADALGDAVHAGSVASASHGLTVGFVWSYPPPGEVAGLRLDTGNALSWQPEPSAGVYNLYRGSIAALDGVGYGACRQIGIAGTTTTDVDPVPPGAGFFYLITAENLLGEEGSPGSRSNGAARPIAVACP